MVQRRLFTGQNWSVANAMTNMTGGASAAQQVGKYTFTNTSAGNYTITVEDLDLNIKSGGVLVYLLCSTENENEKRMWLRVFLKNILSLKVDDIKQYLPETGRMLVDERVSAYKPD